MARDPAWEGRRALAVTACPTRRERLRLMTHGGAIALPHQALVGMEGGSPTCAHTLAHGLRPHCRPGGHAGACRALCPGRFPCISCATWTTPNCRLPSAPSAADRRGAVNLLHATEHLHLFPTLVCMRACVRARVCGGGRGAWCMVRPPSTAVAGLLAPLMAGRTGHTDQPQPQPTCRDAPQRLSPPLPSLPLPSPQALPRLARGAAG